MKIQLLSDLHLEENPDFTPQPAPGAEALVLAGDVGCYLPGSALAAQGDADFGLGRFANWPVPVLYLPGNHEYDTFDWDATHARLRAICQRLGLRWLERQSLTLGGVRFIGTTLWSDFDALAPAGGTPSQRVRARLEAMRLSDAFLRTTGATRRGEAFLSTQVRSLGLVCQRWLRAALAVPFDGVTVVVTHFAPSLKSHDPRYGLTPDTAGFCNALDALLPQADLWLHGHLHSVSNYTVGGCRVRANPLGSPGKGECSTFNPLYLLETKEMHP